MVPEEAIDAFNKAHMISGATSVSCCSDDITDEHDEEWECPVKGSTCSWCPFQKWCDQK